MEQNPCHEERRRAVEAARAWEAATAAARSFMIEKPLEPGESIAPKSPEYLDQMQAAFEAEASAREAYIAAMTTWFECEEGSS